jgi:TetR/AcrR family acrAB operon transcriptional repressor
MSPRTGNSLKAQQSADTREAILNSCLQLFARHGVAGTSVDDIARAAGITKGAVYWHFASKDELFQVILDRIRERWHGAVLQRLSKKALPSERVEVLFDGYLELFTHTPDICLFMQRVLLENDETFSPQIGRVFTQTARFLAKIFDEGKATGAFRRDVDGTAMGHLVLGAISGATQQCVANPSLTLKALLSEAKEMTLARVEA